MITIKIQTKAGIIEFPASKVCYDPITEGYVHIYGVVSKDVPELLKSFYVYKTNKLTLPLYMHIDIV